MSDELTAFKAARGALEWTQHEAAAALGVSRASVGHWETGRRRLPAHQLAALLDLASRGGADGWRARALKAEQEREQLAAELKKARAHNEDQDIERRLDERARKHWEQRARAAELERDKLKLEVAAHAARDAEYWRRWREATGEGATSAAPASHPYSAADLRDLAALGLNECATWEQVKQAGSAAAHKHHPDKQGNAAEFQRTRDAFKRLKDRHATSNKGAA